MKSTKQLIDELKQYKPVNCEVADRLEELQRQVEIEKQCADAYYENYLEMLKRIDVVAAERNEARAEVERLKQENRAARDEIDLMGSDWELDEALSDVKRLTNTVKTLTHQLEASRNATQMLADELETLRMKTTIPEPSRLEVVAMVAPAVCHLGCGMDLEVDDFAAACVQVADSIIAAVKS